jgi:23S rRNA (cytidine1920-2'-O)/16S rRNA (cytidine1409-2'-O)-methyltransferase
MVPMAKQRLDQKIFDDGLVDSRNLAQALIRSGKVLVNDQVIDKPGTRVKDHDNIRIKGEIRRFVSRGGDKLLGALQDFELEVTDFICADLGSSTGGFTDCLLQNGAQKVYAIDVGYGQLAWKLRQDERVVVMERVNARHIESLPEEIDCIVADLSFISISKILPAMLRIIKPKGIGILLIKPQFEVGPNGTEGGLVKDEGLREKAIVSCIADFENEGCQVIQRTSSKVPGAKKGNIEELIFVRFPNSSV